MLDALRSCPSLSIGITQLAQEFKKDLNFFSEILHSTNGVFKIHDDNRLPTSLYIDTFNKGALGLY